MEKKQMFINLGAQVIAVAVGLLISFFITPMIVEHVGKESYGFLGLANNFTGYITVITVALNALAGRFVTVSIYRNKIKDANEYFNSVMITNFIISIVLIIPSIIFIINLENILQLPPDNVTDIRMTFIYVFLSFFINLICSILSVATFATNKIYLSSIRNIESNLIRIAMVFALFYCIEPKISFVSLGVLTANIFVACTNFVYTRKLLPQIHISRKYFNLKKVKELIFSGCWNSITSLSNMLLEGLDLLITNIFIGAAEMGTVSIVKTIPNILNQFMGSILNVFLPQITIDYAKNNKDNIVQYIDYSCKMIGTAMAIPLAFLIIMGRQFYALWLPGENANILTILSILSLSGLLFGGSVNIMYNLYNVTNNLKMPAIATLITGILNTTIVLILLKFTSLGIYAVVGTSSMLGIIRNLFFNVPYSAYCIKIRPKIFYKMVVRSLIMTIIAAILGYIITLAVNPNNWIKLFVCAFVMAILSLSSNFVIFFKREEKKEVINIFLGKFFRR